MQLGRGGLGAAFSRIRGEQSNEFSAHRWRTPVNVHAVLRAAKLLIRSVPVALIAVCAFGPLAASAQDVNITPPNLGNEPAGALAGQAGVTQTGAAIYSLPLPIPPGTAGLQPTLALNYSSQTGDGLLGPGWSIAGLSSVTRCGKTYAQDGVRTGVTLTSDDQFCLDGRRLKLVSGVHGGSAEYRVEVDNFGQVLSVGDASGVDRWIVRAKNGLIYTYGSRADSRVEAQGKSVVLSWALARVEDRRGNYYDYDYEENNAEGEHYLKRIRYTGNTRTGAPTYNAIEFFLSGRPDPWRGYVMGSLVQRRAALYMIKTLVNTAADGSGGTVVREFHLNLDVHPVTGRLFLKLIIDCTGDGDCLTPTTFSWSTRAGESNSLNAPGSGNWGGPAITIDEAVGNPLVGIPSQQVQSKAVVGDFNGDGLSDLFYSDGTSNQWRICLSSGSAFNCQAWTAVVARSEETISGDLNGDGLTDIAIPPAALSGTANWNVCLSTGSGFSCSAWSGRTAGKSPQRYQLSDMDGDGRDDLLMYDQTNASFLCRSNGSGFDACVPYANVAGALSTGNDPEIRVRTARRATDLNGDGRIDFVKYVMRTGTPASGRWETYLATDTGFVLGPQSVSAGIAIATPTPGATIAIDYNADPANGYGDVAAAIGTGLNTAVFEVCQSTGVSLLCSTRPNDPARYVESFGDFDRDGKIDFLSGGSICQLTDTQAGPCTTLASAEPPPATGVLLGDFNGDGLLDHAYYLQSTGQWTVRLTGTGAIQNLLTQVTDGVGHVVQFSHVGAEDRTVHQLGARPPFPARLVTRGIPLVSQFRQSNGLGGWLTTDYRYEGLKTDAQGRGSLGFGKFTSIDQVSGISTTVTLAQQHPYVGMTLESRSVHRNGVVLTAVTNSLGSLSTSGGATYPYVKASSVATRDLSGAPISTTTSVVSESNGIDAFGNITASTETITEPEGDVYTSSTANVYENRVNDWLLGLLTSRTVTKGVATSGTGLTPPMLTLRRCVGGASTQSPTRAALSCILGNTGQTGTTSVTYGAPAGVSVSGPAACPAGTDDCGSVLVLSGTSPGMYTGTVSASAGSGGGASLPISLTVLPTPAAIVASGTIDALSVAPAAATGVVTFTNDGQTATSLTVSITGGASLSTTSISCPASAACSPSLTVTSPASPGSYSGQLTVTSSAGGSVPAPIAVKLRVLAPANLVLSLIGGSGTTVSPTAATATYRVGNSGQATASGITYAASGGLSVSGGPTSCAAETPDCGSVQILSGTSPGVYAGTVSASAGSGGGASLPISLTVQATPAAIVASGTIDALSVAPTAATGVVTFTNNGQTATSLTVSVSGGATPSTTSISCPANAACSPSLTVTSPASPGSYNGQLTVTSSAGGSVPGPIAVKLRVLAPANLVLSLIGSSGTTVSPTVATATYRVGNGGQVAANGITYTASGGLSVSGGPASCAAETSDCGAVTVSTGTSASNYAGTFTAAPASGGGAASTTVSLSVLTPPTLLLNGCSQSSPTVSPSAASMTCQLSNTGQTAAASIQYSSIAGAVVSGPTSCAAGSACGAVSVSTGGGPGVYAGTLTATPSSGIGSSVGVSLTVHAPPPVVTTTPPPPLFRSVSGLGSYTVDVTANVANGTAPFTYAWTVVTMNGASPSIGNPSSATATLTTRANTACTNTQAVYRVTVTDAIGRTAAQDVLVTVKSTSPPLGKPCP